jgi:hypothetical protein
MLEGLRRDYENTKAMIFGAAPDFDAILSSIASLEARANREQEAT